MTPVSTEAIVLKSVRYKENDFIVRILTRQLGLQSYLIHAPQSKRSRFRASYLLPLTCLSLEVEHSPKRDLGRVLDARVIHMHLGTSSHIAKTSIAFFLADVIAATLPMGEPDETLFDFLLEQTDALDGTQEGIGAFHQHFLSDYARHLGFDACGAEDDYIASLGIEDKRLFQSGAEGGALTRIQRRRWTDLFLAYLRHQLPGMGAVDSLDVLNQLLD